MTERKSTMRRHSFIVNAVSGVLVTGLVATAGVALTATGVAFALPFQSPQPQIAHFVSTAVQVPSQRIEHVRLPEAGTAKTPPKHFCENIVDQHQWCSRTGWYEAGGFPKVRVVGIVAMRYTNFIVPKPTKRHRYFVLHQAKSGWCAYGASYANEPSVLIGKCTHDKQVKYQWFYRESGSSPITGKTVYQIESRVKGKGSNGTPFPLCIDDPQIATVLTLVLVQCGGNSKQVPTGQLFYWTK